MLTITVIDDVYFEIMNLTAYCKLDGKNYYFHEVFTSWALNNFKSFWEASEFLINMNLKEFKDWLKQANYVFPDVDPEVLKEVIILFLQEKDFEQKEQEYEEDWLSE